MGDISTYTYKIKNAIYGEEVRESIVSALDKVNDDNNSYQAIKADISQMRDEVHNDLIASADTLTALETETQKAQTTQEILNSSNSQATKASLNLATKMEEAEELIDTLGLNITPSDIGAVASVIRIGNTQCPVTGMGFLGYNGGVAASLAVEYTKPIPGQPGEYQGYDYMYVSTEGHRHMVSDIDGELPIENGGTGAASASEALANLGAASSNHTHSTDDITSGILSIANGGTGASTASDAFVALSEDTGWQDLDDTFNTQYWTNGATSINARFKPVEYRRIGKQIFIDGFFKCNDLNNSFGTEDEKTIFVLPAGYRPHKSLYWRLPMSGQQYAKVYVTEGGTVGMDFTTATALVASTWFNFNNVSFFVD